MKIKLALIVSLVISILSCTSLRKEGNNVVFEKKEELVHKTYDTELLFSNAHITVIDSLVLIVTIEQDPICRVYSINQDMKEVYSYGKIGKGPGEFIQPFLTYSDKNVFGLNEVNRQELALMELTSLAGEYSIREKVRLKAPYKRAKGELIPADLYFVKLDETHYASLLYADNGRFFSLLDSTLSHINHFGESPISEEVPYLTLFRRLNGCIAAQNGALAFAPRNLPYLSFYKLVNEEMQKQWSFYFREPFYGVRNGDILFDKEKTRGQVLDLQLDDQYIYLLYSNKLLSENDKLDISSYAGNLVLVFDYNGKGVAELNLSCWMRNIALSVDRTKLYGIAQLPEPTIVEFDLPSYLSDKR